MQLNYRIPKGSSGPVLAGMLSLLAAFSLLWTRTYVLIDGWLSPGYAGVEEFIALLFAALFALFGLALLLFGRRAPAVSAVIAVPICILIALYAPKTLEFGYAFLSGSTSFDVAYLSRGWIVLWALPLAVIGALVAYCVVCFRKAAGPAMPAVVIVLCLVVWGAYSYLDGSWQYSESMNFSAVLNRCILPYVGVGLFLLSLFVMLCSFSKKPEAREQRFEQKAYRKETLRRQKAEASVVGYAPQTAAPQVPSHGDYRQTVVPAPSVEYATAAAGQLQQAPAGFAAPVMQQSTPVTAVPELVLNPAPVESVQPVLNAGIPAEPVAVEQTAAEPMEQPVTDPVSELPQEQPDGE